MKNQIFLSFPLTGKTYLSKKYPDIFVDGSDIEFKDNKEFLNWLESFDKKDSDKKILLNTTKQEYIEVLKENNIDFHIVYPDPSLKEEYINRLKSMNISEEEKIARLELLEKTFTDDIFRLQNETSAIRIILTKPENNSLEYVMKELHLLEK